jgi:hypothetical protein
MISAFHAILSASKLEDSYNLIKMIFTPYSKKIDVFSPEKNGDTLCKLRLFRAECWQLGRAGQLGNIQW